MGRTFHVVSERSLVLGLFFDVAFSESLINPSELLNSPTSRGELGERPGACLVKCMKFVDGTILTDGRPTDREDVKRHVCKAIFIGEAYGHHNLAG
jgi:hypothetical protein